MPTPTARLLLARRELALGLLTPADALPVHALDAAISWAHSSDLADPTPFLAPGQLLLTTGTQFGADEHRADEHRTDEHRAADQHGGARSGGVTATKRARAATRGARGGATSDFDDYVTRLTVRGVVALGFGTEVIRDTPAGLVAACLRAGLPLLEVPYRTPFIAVSRHVADLVAEEVYARGTWALSAQRALSLAALRPHGLATTLGELARQLGRWVALVDAQGTLDRAYPAGELTTATRITVEREAERMLRVGRRAASTVAEGGTSIALQTIGASGHLLGVLAHGGGGDVDQAAQQVVTSVVALAGLALERERELESARGAARRALSRALDGAALLAEDLGDAAGLDGDTASAVARLAHEARSRDGLATEESRVERAGGARPGGARAGGEEASDDARGRAGVLLAPLLARDPSGALAETLRVWLECNGVYDAAARELGVHRHTVTARVRTAERLLDRDLGRFAARAELWSALHASVET
jgi:purine catabolism regulator